MNSSRNTPPLRHPATLLCHPLVLLAIAVTALNDHVLKGAGILPGVITGKLSDITGLFFFPILVAVLLYLAIRMVANWLPTDAFGRATTSHLLYIDIAVIVTALGFTAINVVEPVNRLANQVWGSHTMDPTDLLCLPIVVVARQFAKKRWPLPAKPQTNMAFHSIGWHRAFVLVLAVLVSLATSYTHIPMPSYPTWTIDDPVVECREEIEIQSWIAKSGKEGAGMVLRFHNRSEGSRTVELHRAEMIIRRSEGTRARPMIVEGRRVAPIDFDESDSLYVPFVFDNHAAWNDSMRDATIGIELSIDGALHNLEYEASHRSAPWLRHYHHQTHQLRSSSAQQGEPNNGNDSGQYVIIDHVQPPKYRIRFEQDPTGGCMEGRND